MARKLTPQQSEQALRLLWEARDVLSKYWFTGSYNNEDVIAIDDKIVAFFDSLEPPR